MNFKEQIENMRKISQEIESNLSAIRTVAGSGNPIGIYVSMPVSTGKRMYDLLEKLNFTSPDELKIKEPERYKKEVFEANIAEGTSTANALRAQGHPLVICPAEFVQRKWTDAVFMAFWESVIKDYAKEIKFSDQYQFSTGCAEELLIGVRYDKEMRHCKDNSIVNPVHEVDILGQTIEHLYSKGIDATRLMNIYLRLEPLVK